MISNTTYHWNILGKMKKGVTSVREVIDVLLENRGLFTKKQKKEFLHPAHPDKLEVKGLGISENSLNKTITRIRKALDNNEKIVIYGDYDADGVCATAILWETLYAIKANAHPYLPDRFSEGYGLNAESITKLKTKDPNLSLIITVDNGIVANDAIVIANKLGIDVVITDHHEKSEKLPEAFAIIHTTKLGGAGIAWILAREIEKKFKISEKECKANNSLELAAIGTIADQIPLIGPNRSIAKFGLERLNKTVRPGLLSLYSDTGLTKGEIESYQVGFIIAPRINAMGRMEHAIDSLRLLCTKDLSRARQLSRLLGKTNSERQRIVEEVVVHARQKVLVSEPRGAIILSDESYHEGIIGLAASRLVEEFYRPAIVISRGALKSKASARSISGFNIIENIRKINGLLLGGGGHPMAAGFSIETEKIDLFIEEFEKVASPLLSTEMLTKKLRIDLKLNFVLINRDLVDTLKDFEPTGLGNPTPTFITESVTTVDARTVGQGGKHLKLTLEKEGKTVSAIGFGFGQMYGEIAKNPLIDIAYSVDENVWNGNSSIQLKIKDLKI